jgi:hypothetical protein
VTQEVDQAPPREDGNSADNSSFSGPGYQILRRTFCRIVSISHMGEDVKGGSTEKVVNVDLIP